MLAAITAKEPVSSRQHLGPHDHGSRSLDADTGVERAISSAPAPPRAAAGRRSAQRMGRPPKLTAAQQAEARRRRAEGATLAELARSYDLSEKHDFKAHLVVTRRRIR